MHIFLKMPKFRGKMDVCKPDGSLRKIQVSKIAQRVKEIYTHIDKDAVVNYNKHSPFAYDIHSSTHIYSKLPMTAEIHHKG